MNVRPLPPQTDLTALLLRLALAAVFVVHGILKLVQYAPLVPEMDMTTQTVVGWLEVLCGAALTVGLLSRVAAVGLIVLQSVAIALVTGKHALEAPPMRPGGADYTTVGPEYNMVLIAMCLGVVLLGSGVWSLDHLLIARQLRRAAAPAPQPVPAPLPTASTPAA